MNCPKCGKKLTPNARQCKHCGVRIIRKSDKIAQKMTMNSRLAKACGGMLVMLSLALFFYRDFTWGAVLLGLGALLFLIGKKMR